MNDQTGNHLFVIGLGYTAQLFARRLLDAGFRVSGTTRSEAKAAHLAAAGFSPVLFDGTTPSRTLADRLGSASHLLISAAPNAKGDPALICHRAEIEGAAARLQWAGYLSTVGVYGDHGGAWIDETTTPEATSPRAQWRINAEREWLALQQSHGLPIHVFRLAGIYGPGRSPLQKLREGKSRRIIKTGQVFNRIHVEDIATTLAASINRPNPGAIYNVTDGHPAPPQEVILHAAHMLGIEPPPAEDFNTAEMTPMARSFYSGNRRIGNRRITKELGVTLKYPNYQSGLAAILKAEQA